MNYSYDRNYNRSEPRAEITAISRKFLNLNETVQSIGYYARVQYQDTVAKYSLIGFQQASYIAVLFFFAF